MVSALFKTPDLEIPRNPVSNLSAARAELMARRSDDPPSAVQPYKSGVGIRVHAADVDGFGEVEGQGYSDFVRLHDGLFVRITDIGSARPFGMRFLAEDWLKLDFWISGKTSLIFRGVGQIDFKDRWCFVHLHRDEVEKGEWAGVNNRNIGAMIYLSPSYLKSALEDELDLLPPAFRRFADGAAPQTLFELLPLNQIMAQAVVGMVRTPYLGNIRRMFIEAKAAELLSTTIQALVDRVCPNEAANVIRLTRAEQARLEEVRDRILSDLANLPKIAELARQAGMNQQKLQKGFKQLFGQTIFDFSQAYRLDKARKLLEKREQNISQIALTVGYEFSNNFSTAFKRQYGISPKVYQRNF